MSLSAIDALILAKIYDRPAWARTLQPVRARVLILIEAGLAERIAPPSRPHQRGRNMVAITAGGGIYD